MSVVAFASVKASPGVTTTVVAVGHVWPARRGVVVVEADPAAGDLAARHGLPVQPGLATLAAAGRRALSPELVADHTQRVGGLPVLVAHRRPLPTVPHLRCWARRSAPPSPGWRPTSSWTWW